MEMLVDRVDCRKFLLEERQPILILDLKGQAATLRGGRWLVVTKVVKSAEPVDWGVYSEGAGLLRIPLFPYGTRGRQPESLFGAGVQIGLRAAMDLPAQPKKIFLALGDVYGYGDDHRMFLGMAFNL